MKGGDGYGVAFLSETCPGLGVLEWNPQSGEISCSKEFAALWGFGENEFPGTFADIARQLHPEDLAALQRISQGNFDIELRVLLPSGETRWLNCKGSAKSGADGKRIFAIASDISAHKLAEKALLIERNQFRRTIEVAPVAMVMVDAEGWIELVNVPFEQIFGYERNELLGRKIEVLLPGNLHHRHEKQRNGFMAHAEARQMGQGRELYGITKDGRRITLEIGLSPMETESGLHVIATVADITLRKKQIAALTESELRYRGVIEAAPDGFWLVNSEGKLTAVNEAYSRMSGYSREELLQLSISHLEAKEKPEETAAHMSKVMKEGHDRFETQHRRKDGSTWPAEITVSVIQSLNEVYVFIRDLTEMKAFEAERARAEALIHNLAFHDPLTQLPNRRLLLDRLGQAMAAARRSRLFGALLFIDLDKFKELNDTFGHEMGDLLLVQVAARLKECVREEDTVARLGGDEFVVMLSVLAKDAAGSERLTRLVGEKILDALNELFRLENIFYRSTPSIGATLFLDDEDANAIFRRADSAMYQVKKTGRNALRFAVLEQPA